MNILELLKQDGIEPRQKTANEYSSSCPVCGGNDRFQSWPDRNTWYCRGCDKSGDLIEYCRFCRGLSFAEACKMVGELQKLNNDFSTSTSSGKPQRAEWKPKPKAKTNDTWLEKASILVDWCHEQLLNNSEMLKWLEQARGLNVETIKRFKIGFNPSTKYRPRKSWSLPEELNDKGKPKKLWIPAGLVIPAYDGKGYLIRVKFRLFSKSFKYYLLPGSLPVFGFYGDNKKRFVLVESELDALLIHQETKGTFAAIATGSAANRPDKAETEALKKADCFLNSLDADEAGTKNAWKFWHKNFSNCRRWPIPERFGKDQTEAFKNGLDLNLWLFAAQESQEKESKITEIKPQNETEVSKRSKGIESLKSSRENLLNETFALLEELEKTKNFPDLERLTRAINTLKYSEAQNDIEAYEWSLDFLESLYIEIIETIEDHQAKNEVAA